MLHSHDSWAKVFAVALGNSEENPIVPTGGVREHRKPAVVSQYDHLGEEMQSLQS